MSMFNNTQYLYSPTLTENSYGGGGGIAPVNHSVAPPQTNHSLERNGVQVMH